MDKQLWDIFISHASEDKDEIARPLAKALRQAGLRVWYDEFILKLGDSISDLIREGQNKSTYALIILSPNFFANEKWARHELKGFITREVYEGKTIIPVWHKVTPQDVRRFAPDLADKIAMSTSRGLDVVVQEIVSLFKTKGEEEVGQIERPVKEEQPVKKPPIIRLRSEPLVVSRDDAQKIFGVSTCPKVFGYFAIPDGRHQEGGAHQKLMNKYLIDPGYPLEYIQNDYEAQDDVVIDHAAGLMWQKSGSSEELIYLDIQKYVKELNHQKFASYNDWRLPTIPELMSLLEPKKQRNNLYINSIFDNNQTWCWSADRLPEGKKSSSGAAWYVNFNLGLVHWVPFIFNIRYVRCVRSRQD